MADYLTTADLANLLGVKPATLRFLRAQSKPGGRYASDPFPEPDLVIAQSPAWEASRASEIKAWNARRPGQGSGGGRPRKETPGNPHTTTDHNATAIPSAL